MKKSLKIIGKILLILLIITILLLVICFFYQMHARRADKEYLEQHDLLHYYDAGDYQMNICKFGDGAHQLIVMPGSGDAEFTADMRDFAKYLRDDISLVVVTRPGYGVTEETDAEITTEYIVDSTRTALRNAGIEAPYTLMPHSMSGMYATYWEYTYPEEIDSMIFLDTINPATMEDTEEDQKQYRTPLLYQILYKLGVNRSFNDIFVSAYRDEFTALFNYNPKEYSRSIINEMMNFNQNMRTAWSLIKEDEIPKLYVSTDFETFEDAEAFVTALYDMPDPDTAQKWWDAQQTETEIAYREKRAAYLEAIGNCEVVNIPGSHFIYNQKPEEVAQVIADFVDKQN